MFSFVGLYGLLQYNLFILARVEASLCTAVVVFPYQVLRYYRSTHEKILLMNITPNPIPDYPS